MQLREQMGIFGIDADLEYIVREGLAYVVTDDLVVLPRMLSLGASPTELLGTVPLREALKARIRQSRHLSEPFQQMALCLLGATDDTRDKTLDGRLEAVGEVGFRGKRVGIDAVRRRPDGLRWEILRHLADDLVRGGLDARRATGLEPMPEMIEGGSVPEPTGFRDVMSASSAERSEAGRDLTIDRNRER